VWGRGVTLLLAGNEEGFVVIFLLDDDDSIEVIFLEDLSQVLGLAFPVLCQVGIH
jgi:hypothetical protein